MKFLSTYNFTVDWGDGSPTSDITSYNDADRIHSYVATGDHQISVTGTMSNWNFGAEPASKDQIISLDDAGDVGFGVGVTNMAYMFQGASNLTTVSLFDTSAVTTMIYMFSRASSLTTVPLFDTSAVTVMIQMFSEATSLTTVPLFDTSAVTNMNQMFYGASSLTTIPLLDTSSVTSMNRTFQGTSSLTTLPLLDTSSVTDFLFIFFGATSVNQGAFSGTRYDISYYNTNMGATALRDVFAGLGTAAGAQTVTVTGNPGQAELTPADCAVAEGKGWTVEPACTAVPSNNDPTDISLTSNSVEEGQSTGATVGTLSTTDADGGDTHTYFLVAGTGDTDNASFQLSGDTLQTNEIFDFATKNNYSIRIQTNDGNGGTFEEAFTITITEVSTTPDNFCTAGDISTLTNPLPDLIYWDWDGNNPYTANSEGTAVSALIAPAETVLTTAETTAIDGSAEPGMVYFNSETNELIVADSGGNLQTPTSTKAVADTGAVAASAVVGEVYFNTTTGEIFECETAGTLATPADPSASCLTQ